MDGFVYLVWKGYQRRVEVLGPKLGAEVFYLPHLFRSRMLRPFDYIVKLARSFEIVRAANARLVFVQAPPIYGALAALCLGIPYVIDAHNGVWQGSWSRLPMTDLLLRKARAVIVHNTEIAAIARRRLPEARLVVVCDPIEPIRRAEPREPDRVLFICSFDVGEPVELIADVIAAMQEYRFFITADPGKLPRALRARLRALRNLTFTGYLPVDQYQRLLCSSAVAVVLEEGPHTQPSGACEALASDTPLVLTASTLTRELFGDWARLVEHRPADLVAAIREAAAQRFDLGPQRHHWNRRVNLGLAMLQARLAEPAFAASARAGPSR